MVNLPEPDNEELPVPDQSSPNEETAAQPSVAEIRARLAAEQGRPVPNPIELETYAGPEHHLAEQPAPAAPLAPGRAPVERKVVAGLVWSGLGATVLMVLGALAQNIDVLAPVLAAAPLWVKFGVLVLGSLASQLYGAYRAPHTPRPDLAEG